MRITQVLLIVAVLATVGMVGSAYAANFYVVQDQLGQATVVRGNHPGIGWTIIGGPYANKDAALRDLGGARAVKPTAPPMQSAFETPAAGGFYVVRDASNQLTVIQGEVPVGWAVVSGPYASRDMARRLIAGAQTPTALPMRGYASVRTGDYFVVKDSMGQTAVIQGRPGPGWQVVQGPFKHVDEAQRARGSAPLATALPSNAVLD